jgi:hypothetical protein
MKQKLRKRLKRIETTLEDLATEIGLVDPPDVRSIPWTHQGRRTQGIHSSGHSEGSWEDGSEGTKKDKERFLNRTISKTEDTHDRSGR